MGGGGSQSSTTTRQVDERQVVTASGEAVVLTDNSSAEVNFVDPGAVKVIEKTIQGGLEIFKQSVKLIDKERADDRQTIQMLTDQAQADDTQIMGKVIPALTFGIGIMALTGMLKK